MKKIKDKKLWILILFIFLGSLILFLGINKIDDLSFNKEKGVYAQKLDLISKYGDKEAVHPKIISFEEKWNGYKYWMSFSPYPKGDSSKENPHVVVSNDKIKWKKLDNYLLDEPKDFANGKRYNSDPHLVYNYDKDELECYWRYVDDKLDQVTIYRRTTKDGINWTKKEIVFKEQRSKKDYVSLSLIYEDGIYKMWYVQYLSVYYMESKDLKNWTKPELLKINYSENVKTWHIDVILTEKGYEMLMVALTSWPNRFYMDLYYSYSSDNKDWSTAEKIFEPATNTNEWYNSGLYRSTMLYENGIYYVYFTGQATDRTKGVGLLKGNDITNLKIAY